MLRPTPSSNEITLQDDAFIVSKTDTKGKIVYGNKYFLKISGYREEELLGAPHSILRHPEMPKIIFKLLWERIKAKQEIFAYVKNLCKDGSYYWVLANVTATLDPQGNIRDFHSVRRKPSAEAMREIPQLYARLLEAERSGGMEASQRVLDELLNEKGVSYDHYILNFK